MLPEFQAGYSSAKAVFDIAKGIQSLKTETAINQAVIDIQRNAIEAQQALSTLDREYAAALKRIEVLEQEIVRLKEWEGEKDRYQLKRFQPGVLAYELKPEMAGADPPHRLCYDCYQKGRKGALNATNRVERFRFHRCTSCSTETPLGDEMAVGDTPPPPPPNPKVIRYPPHPEDRRGRR